jgi:hypothetical protein
MLLAAPFEILVIGAWNLFVFWCLPAIALAFSNGGLNFWCLPV